MTVNKSQPTISTKGDMGERLDHPAFGMMSVSKMGVGKMQLFGSELKHREAVRVQIHDAYTVRDLSKNWNHTGKLLASFYMSEAQWAALMSSHNRQGVPVTFEYKAVEDAGLQECPEIEMPEDMSSNFKKEMKDKADKAMAGINDLVESLKGCVSGDLRLSKKTMESMLMQAELLQKNIPSNMAYVMGQFEEAMQDTVESGKLEFEAHVTRHVQELGIEALRNKTSVLEIGVDRDTDSSQ